MSRDFKVTATGGAFRGTSRRRALIKLRRRMARWLGSDPGTTAPVRPGTDTRVLVPDMRQFDGKTEGMMTCGAVA
jgi:hypothetical protein